MCYIYRLYYFESDEPDTCVGMILVESCTVTVPKIGGTDASFEHIDYTLSRHGDGVVFKDFEDEESFPFVITTIGGV